MSLFLLLLFLLVYKKQLDNKREHSGTEQMSSDLKAQRLEEVIKKKFKFSNDDNDVDGDDDEEDFCLSIFLLNPLSIRLSLILSQISSAIRYILFLFYWIENFGV